MRMCPARSSIPAKKIFKFSPEACQILITTPSAAQPIRIVLRSFRLPYRSEHTSANKKCSKNVLLTFQLSYELYFSCPFFSIQCTKCPVFQFFKKRFFLRRLRKHSMYRLVLQTGSLNILKQVKMLDEILI